MRALQRSAGNAATGALLARYASLQRQPAEQKIRDRAYSIWERRVRTGAGGDTQADYYEAQRQIEIEERAHQIWETRPAGDAVANYYAAERELAERARQVKLDELGKRLAALSSTLDKRTQELLQESVDRAKRAKFGTSEAIELTIYAEEAASRLSSLQSQGKLNDVTVIVGRKRTIVVKPIYVTTTTFDQPVSPAVWRSQFEDCRRVWAGLGVSFQEEQASQLRLDDATDAGHLLNHDGGLPNGDKLGKGRAMTRFDELMGQHKPTGNVLPVFILPTKLAAEQTDGTTANARTVYIAGNRASVNVLAHEMSHVLGIDHPKYDEDDFHTHTGEKKSIADPSGGKGPDAPMGGATKTNPLSHYDLIDSYEKTEKKKKIAELLQFAELDRADANKRFQKSIQRGARNAKNVTTFPELQWESPEAKAEAVGIGEEMKEISAKINRLKVGDVLPEELGIAYPVRVMVEDTPVVIFGHD